MKQNWSENYVWRLSYPVKKQNQELQNVGDQP